MVLHEDRKQTTGQNTFLTHQSPSLGDFHQEHAPACSSSSSEISLLFDSCHFRILADRGCDEIAYEQMQITFRCYSCMHRTEGIAHSTHTTEHMTDA